jgi:hypothetical protein
MPLPIRQIVVSPAASAFFMAMLSCGAVSSCAQNSGLDLSLHANDHATAADIGLPTYPGASPYKELDNDAAFDLGFSSGDSHFRLMVANYITSDSPAEVLGFYRKPLSRYGEVLECKDGKPVGKLKITRSGLTCSDEKSGNSQANGHADSTDHDLRAGSPHNFRVVGIDKSQPKSTHFGLIYVQLPKDNDTNAKSK